jgi:hypothetical protein
MNVQSQNPHDVERDRLRLFQELSAVSGEKWTEAYQPGSAGCHELLDRTALVGDMLERHVLAHPACVARPEWYLLAEQAAEALRELCQQVGTGHLAAQPLGSKSSE